MSDEASNLGDVDGWPPPEDPSRWCATDMCILAPGHEGPHESIGGPMEEEP